MLATSAVDLFAITGAQSASAEPVATCTSELVDGLQVDYFVGNSNASTGLRDKKWNHGVASGVDVTLLGRFYERFADRAVEIGDRVVFQATEIPIRVLHPSTH